ncbi:MAG: FAD-dependent oxidoreductase, partial [Candidatus Dormibacteraeota bacterium]|nr:FAD-dependent oxidoreductase [Candidatus Dormibacteraeota bacterium]
MAQVIESDVKAFRADFGGTVLAPGDAGYDQARSIWNGDIDKRPAVVARCATSADVAAAIRFARAQDLEIAIRGGGHSPSGACLVDGGLVIDLTQMNEVLVDPAARRAIVGGGASLAQLDAATQAHGLAVPAGTVSHTGVAGLTLGGGAGWLTARAGLSIDNLVSAEVVT